MSSLERCPLFGVPFIERFHYLHVLYSWCLQDPFSIEQRLALGPGPVEERNGRTEERGACSRQACCCQLVGCYCLNLLCLIIIIIIKINLLAINNVAMSLYNVIHFDVLRAMNNITATYCIIKVCPVSLTSLV